MHVVFALSSVVLLLLSGAGRRPPPAAVQAAFDPAEDITTTVKTWYQAIACAYLFNIFSHLLTIQHIFLEKIIKIQTMSADH
jgi:hypothetical protein